MWNTYILSELARDIMRSAHADAERRRQAEASRKPASHAPGGEPCCIDNGTNARREAVRACAPPASIVST